MSVEYFLDTNILVYAAAGRGAEEPKRIRALELIENENFGISSQVLQEFYVTVVRKIEIPLSPEQALAWIDQFANFPCISIDVPIVKLGIEFSERYQISYWDGAILASAEALGAAILYSEDLNDGQLYNNTSIGSLQVTIRIGYCPVAVSGLQSHRIWLSLFTTRATG